MHIVVNKTLYLNGKAILPGSKSQSVRGMFFALLAKGKSILSNVLDSNDTQTTIDICKTMGAEIVLQNGTLTLTSNGLRVANTESSIYTGNSGIATRFVMPLLGLRENHMHPILVNCGEQMRARPIKPLLDALETLGMRIKYVEVNGQFPVLVSGQLQGGVAEINGITSQYLSSLLISLPCAHQDSVIKVKNLHERPYAEMTLAWLNQQEINYDHQQKDGTDIFLIKGGQFYRPFKTNITGDFSSASCLLAAASLFPGEIELHGLTMSDQQGDKQLIPLLQKMGANIIVDGDKIKIKGGQPLNGISIDTNSIPDLLPALAVIATQAAGKTIIHNVKQARIKETDRINSMTQGLTRMGAKIEEHADGMTIYQSNLHGAIVNGYNDHRTVMALSIAGMLADGQTLISDADAIAKTYPGFIESIKRLGAQIDLTETKKNKHIILFGFKHVGKSLIGKNLAVYLEKKFIDLDVEVENHYEAHHSNCLTCRQIMQLHGEAYYRKLEKAVLLQVLQTPSAVIALGGGTLLDRDNQDQVASHLLLHITAPRGIVFERIMVSGRPAFFDLKEDPYESFTRLWEERSAIFKKLTNYTIDNNSSLDHAISQAKVYIKNEKTT